MSVLKRLISWILISILLILPLASCSQEKKPEKKETKTAETVTAEEKVSEGEKTFGDKLRESIEPDPLFPDPPQDDEEFNVLFIGNSYSFYWPDELEKLLTAAGYENVMVCNIYHSGATFEQHWTWHQNKETEEEFYIYRSGKEQKVWEDVVLDECLSYANWDFISFQQSNRYVNNSTSHRASIANWLPQLYSYVYAMFPDATYFWQQNWSHSAGKDSYETTEKTEKYLQWHREEALLVCADWGFINTPLGNAWKDLRYDPLFYSHSGDYINDNPTKSFHTRIHSNGEVINSDLSHDGDIGGGQYLNACVWFEMLTHKSVVGNSFVPVYHHEESGKDYTFTAEQIEKLQNAAHKAVFDDYGEEWYK